MDHGGGSHMWDVRLDEFFHILYVSSCQNNHLTFACGLFDYELIQWVNVSVILYIVTVLLIKIAILLQYLKIFVPTRKDDNVLFFTTHCSLWSIVIFYFVTTIFEVVMCNPRQKIWNPLTITGHCYDTNATYIAIGLFNVLSDFILLIIPMYTFWKLHLPLRKNVLMIAVFTSGLL